MHNKYPQLPSNEDLRVFLAVVRQLSFAKAAIELGVSPAYISKRIHILENTLQVKLFHRRTRSIALTENGEKAHHWATQILGDLDNFMGDVASTSTAPQGKLRIACSFGFGRRHIAPALSLLAQQHPQLDIQLIITDKVIDLVAEGFDLEIRVSDDLPNQHIAQKLLDNQRVLCASPEYLLKKGTPKTLADLEHHDCLVIKERDTPFGIWRLQHNGKSKEEHTVRVNGHLASNSGAIVLQWGLDGHGIILRSLWDVAPYIATGQLTHILSDYTQQANIWAVYPTRLSNSAKLKLCVEFLKAQLHT
jgi:Transcriptional regulator